MFVCYFSSFYTFVFYDMMPCPVMRYELLIRQDTCSLPITCCTYIPFSIFIAAITFNIDCPIVLRIWRPSCKLATTIKIGTKTERDRGFSNNALRTTHDEDNLAIFCFE